MLAFELLQIKKSEFDVDKKKGTTSYLTSVMQPSTSSSSLLRNYDEKSRPSLCYDNFFKLRFNEDAQLALAVGLPKSCNIESHEMIICWIICGF